MHNEVKINSDLVNTRPLLEELLELDPLPLRIAHPDRQVTLGNRRIRAAVAVHSHRAQMHHMGIEPDFDERAGLSPDRSLPDRSLPGRPVSTCTRRPR